MWINRDGLFGDEGRRDDWGSSLSRSMWSVSFLQAIFETFSGLASFWLVDSSLMLEAWEEGFLLFN